MNRIDYRNILRTISSDDYVDVSSCFEDLLWHRHHILTDCRGTGSSLFLKTLACFLDKETDSKDAFRRLEIGKWSEFEKFVNAFDVLWLDFSDFEAGSFEDAILYISEKMSEAYLCHYIKFEPKEGYQSSFSNLEYALDIIEKKASVADIQNSLCRLLLTLRGYEYTGHDNKLAVLIDNMVALETIAERHGYLERMQDFLKDYIVHDIYKYCDIFLQIGDAPDTSDSWLSPMTRMVYHYFTVSLQNVRNSMEKMIVEETLQHHFDAMITPLTKELGIEIDIAHGRKIIEQAKREQKKRELEQIRKERMRYAENLSPDIPLFSHNLGIRKKALNKDAPKYIEANILLKNIYRKFAGDFDADAVYRYFQKVDYGKRIVTDSEHLETILKELPSHLRKWGRTEVNASWGSWVQVAYYREKDKNGGLPAKPENLKIYACFRFHDVQSIFVDSIEHLLCHAEEAFAAKIATCNRSDQMCYWLSQKDFCHLEDFYRPHFSEMTESLPFVSYKGKLGISRDFPWSDDSHNATMARIITDYLKSVNSEDDVDLEDMCNNYIAKWNADAGEDANLSSFKNGSALSFVVVLDSLDVILGEITLAESSFLLSGDKKVWRILSDCRCWQDVNNMVKNTEKCLSNRD